MNRFFLDEKGDTTLRFALGLAWAWHDYDLISIMAVHVRPECTMKRVIPRMLEQLQKRPGERQPLFIIDKGQLVDPVGWDLLLNLRLNRLISCTSCVWKNDMYLFHRRLFCGPCFQLNKPPTNLDGGPLRPPRLFREPSHPQRRRA